MGVAPEKIWPSRYN
ncbi:helix-turn-helix domain-containing protein [Salmonella enterica]|nr:helix-turn-helix domain-containing protein [Salmonella enterica]